jgi:prepilin-type N-terminal cleavage/methylation domain-containing protein
MDLSSPCIGRPRAPGILPRIAGNPDARIHANRKAFTLIELMVVVALIGILAAVIGFSLSGGSQAAALDNAQRNLLSMIQAAKANAVLEGAPARLIIYADTNPIGSSDTATVVPKMLRFYGVIYSSTDSTGNVTWTAANEGAYLPSGIYFVPNQQASSFVAGTLPPKTGFGASTPNALTTGQTDSPAGSTTPSPAFGTMTLSAFPSSQPLQANNGGDTYYYVQFTPDGTFHDPTSGTTTANLIIGAADPISDQAIDFHGSTTKLLSGVQLRFLGIAPFSGIEDITGSQ